MSDNMDKLSGAILTGLSMLKQVMMLQPVALPPQQPGYHACPPTTPHNGYFQPTYNLQPNIPRLPSRPDTPTTDLPEPDYGDQYHF